MLIIFKKPLNILDGILGILDLLILNFQPDSIKEGLIFPGVAWTIIILLTLSRNGLEPDWGKINLRAEMHSS